LAINIAAALVFAAADGTRVADIAGIIELVRGGKANVKLESSSFGKVAIL
jgi:hypothetical protein